MTTKPMKVTSLADLKLVQREIEAQNLHSCSSKAVGNSTQQHGVAVTSRAVSQCKRGDGRREGHRSRSMKETVHRTFVDRFDSSHGRILVRPARACSTAAVMLPS